MSIRIELDDWLNCGGGTKFLVEMQSVPLVGEEIDIHKSLLPQEYLDVVGDALRIDPDTGMAEFTVGMIRHQIDSSGHLIFVCIDINE